MRRLELPADLGDEGRHDMGCNLEEQWANERDYTTNAVRGAEAEVAFPEFIARRGRPLGGA